MTFVITTDRLLIEPLGPQDHYFILELLNSPGWIQFIGERNVKDAASTKTYIDKIIKAPLIHYWVVREVKNMTPVGIVTFLKRDYLEFHDIGFAFLTNYFKQGYAYEASDALMKHIVQNFDFRIFQATTFPDNLSSIKLLEKIGFKFVKELEKELYTPPDGKKLLVYRKESH